MQSRNFLVTLTGPSVLEYSIWRKRFSDFNYILTATDYKKILIYIQFPKVKRYRNTNDVKFSSCDSSKEIISRLKEMDIIEEEGICRLYNMDVRNLIRGLPDYINKSDEEIPESLIRRENAMICSIFSKTKEIKQDLKIYYIYGGTISDRIERALDLIGDYPYNEIFCNKKMWHVIGKRVDTCWYHEFNDKEVNSNCFLDLLDRKIKGLNVPRSFTFNTWNRIIITTKYDPYKLYLHDVNRDDIFNILMKSELIKIN